MWRSALLMSLWSVNDALDKKTEEVGHWEHSKRHAQEKLVEEEGRKGRKMMEEFESAWNESENVLQRKRAWSSCEKHTCDYSWGVKTKTRLKERSAVANWWSWTLCVLLERRGEYGHEENSHDGDDGTCAISQKLCGTVNGRRLSFTKTIFNGISLFPSKHQNKERDNVRFHHSHVKCCCKRVVLPDWGGWKHIFSSNEKRVHEERTPSRHRAQPQSARCARKLCEWVERCCEGEDTERIVWNGCMEGVSWQCWWGQEILCGWEEY